MTQTPEADAAELKEDLRVAFLSLVAAGDEAFARDEDAEAIESWTRALELVAGQASPQLRDSVVARVVVAHARGGGADVALSMLDALPETARETMALRFARARALERSGGASTESLAAWFDAWAAAAREDNRAGVHYARLRARGYAGERDSGVPVVDAVLDGDAKVCAALHLGLPVELDSPPAWVNRCVPGSDGGRSTGKKVGVLLPRTGRLAGLADVHLAALSTAMRLTSPDQQELTLAFEDAGSDEQSAAAGARALLERGVETIVGPIGARQTRAVVDAVAGRARVVNPGPPAGGSEGVAPTLEDRVAALARAGLDEGCKGRWVLLHATGNYGKRGARYFTDLSRRPEFAALVSGGDPLVSSYAPSETSFAKTLRREAGTLAPGRCLMIIDTLSRTSAITRQIRREGAIIGEGGLRVFSTAESLDARSLAGERALAGTVVAPVALPESRSTFQESFQLAAGRPADDQALLLWSALRRAVWGDGEVRPGARVARFDMEGRLDVSASQ